MLECEMASPCDPIEFFEKDHQSPWQGITIPDGFDLKAEGVFHINSREHATHISGPIWEVAKTHDHERNVWGMQLRWIDPNGGIREYAFPRTLLHDSGQGLLVSHLAASGLFILPGQERALKQYLSSFKTSSRVRSVVQTGWVNKADKGLAFVLPDQVIGSADDESIAFQPEENCPSVQSFTCSGDIKQWQQHIGLYLQGNPYLTFNVCAALAGPLLKLLNMDSCGFHLYGASSLGKTSALQVAVSVWGNGADPASCSSSAIQRWNTTANALEGIASAHSDLLLALDELGTFSGGDFGNTVYNLMGGRGKARMNKSAELKALAGWRTVVLSSGEISIQQRIEQDGKTPKAGQLNRFMDIPINNGVIKNTQGMANAAFANLLKESCGRFFGVLGPAFVDRLLAQDISADVLAERLNNRLRDIENQLQIENPKPEQQRAIRRLAVVALAGVLASEFGLLSITSSTVIVDAVFIRDQWLSANQSEQLRGVLKLRDFIQRHQGSRFCHVNHIGVEYVDERDHAGYYLETKQMFALTDAALKEACEGHNPLAVVQELDRLDLLVTSERNRLTYRHGKLPGYDKDARPRLYTVKQAILGFEPGIDVGTGGTMVRT